MSCASTPCNLPTILVDRIYEKGVGDAVSWILLDTYWKGNL